MQGIEDRASFSNIWGKAKLFGFHVHEELNHAERRGLVLETGLWEGTAENTGREDDVRVDLVAFCGLREDDGVGSTVQHGRVDDFHVGDVVVLEVVSGS